MRRFDGIRQPRHGNLCTIRQKLQGVGEDVRRSPRLKSAQVPPKPPRKQTANKKMEREEAGLSTGNTNGTRRAGAVF